MISVSWKLSLIIFAVLPLILIATRKFQKSMKFAFDEVRTQVANLNTFVQKESRECKLCSYLFESKKNTHLFKRSIKNTKGLG